MSTELVHKLTFDSSGTVGIVGEIQTLNEAEVCLYTLGRREGYNVLRCSSGFDII